MKWYPHAFAALAATLVAQDTPPPSKDPFTQDQPKAMQALGVAAYAPFVLADGHRTEDVDRVLGEQRILWLETAHFRIGSTLKATDVPDDPIARKDALEECVRLAKKCSKLQKRPKKLEPWHRLHLFGQRAEEMFADFAKLVGSEDGNTAAGPHLGMPEKYVILLFEKKSDLARFTARFTNRETAFSTRHYFAKTRQQSVLATCESSNDPPTYDEAAFHSQFNYLLASALVEGIDGRVSSTPEWLRLGLAHWYERQIDTHLVMVNIKADEHVDGQLQHKWREKMLARAQHQDLLIPFQQLAGLTDFGFYASIQAWSRVDYLRTLDARKLGEYLVAGKKSPTASRQQQLLEELFGFDGEAFDQKWREWVLKTYK